MITQRHCPTCRGSGQVTVPVKVPYNPLGRMAPVKPVFTTERIECRDCGGSGKVSGR